MRAWWPSGCSSRAGSWPRSSSSGPPPRSWARLPCGDATTADHELATAGGIVIVLAVLVVEGARTALAEFGVGDELSDSLLRSMVLFACFAFAFLGLIDDLLGTDDRPGLPRPPAGARARAADDRRDEALRRGGRRHRPHRRARRGQRPPPPRRRGPGGPGRQPREPPRPCPRPHDQGRDHPVRPDRTRRGHLTRRAGAGARGRRGGRSPAGRPGRAAHARRHRREPARGRAGPGRRARDQPSGSHGRPRSCWWSSTSRRSGCPSAPSSTATPGLRQLDRLGRRRARDSIRRELTHPAAVVALPSRYRHSAGSGDQAGWQSA